MNYQIILDEQKLIEFIDWLPETKPNEQYYCCLFARKKYSPNSNLSSDKAQLKRFTSQKKHLLQKIKQLEVAFGAYEEKGIPIPQEALALYITPNPRCLHKAAKASTKALLDITLDYNGQNPKSVVMSEIQKACGQKIFMDFDFDGVELQPTLDEVSRFINLSAVEILHTKGGFHLLVRLAQIESKYTKTWYQGISGISGCDIRGDNLIPIPGTSQGGFVPYLVNPVEVNDLESLVKIDIQGTIPIKRGCSNPNCFCTGKCQEIIRYEPKSLVTNLSTGYKF